MVGFDFGWWVGGVWCLSCTDCCLCDCYDCLFMLVLFGFDFGLLVWYLVCLGVVFGFVGVWGGWVGGLILCWFLGVWLFVLGFCLLVGLV